MLLMMSLLSACASRATTVVNACAGFSLIFADERDTIETQRQIYVHNKTYEKICKVKDG